MKRLILFIFIVQTIAPTVPIEAQVSNATAFRLRRLSKNPKYCQEGDVYFNTSVKETRLCVTSGFPGTWAVFGSSASAGGGSSFLRSATATVSTNTSGKQNLLPAVPTGRERIVVSIALRNSSIELTDLSFSAGFDTNAADITGLIAPVLSSSRVRAYHLGYSKKGAAGEIFGINFGGSVQVATVAVDVLYYDVDASSGAFIVG